MRSWKLGLSTLALTASLITLAAAQPPDGPPNRGEKGRPGRQRDAGAGGPGAGVRLIPPFMRDSLKLTDEQKKQIADLEKETHEKLMKILTPEQQKQLAEARPQGRGGFGGPGGPRDRGKDKDGPPPPRDPE